MFCTLRFNDNVPIRNVIPVDLSALGELMFALQSVGVDIKLMYTHTRWYDSRSYGGKKHCEVCLSTKINGTIRPGNFV